MFDGLIALGVLGLAAVHVQGERLIPVGAVMAVALLVRRRRPVTVMAVVALAALAQVILVSTVNDPLPFDVAVVIAMYSVVKYARSMVHGYLAAATVAVGIGIEVARHITAHWWAPAVVYAGITSAIWLTAYAMRTRRAYVTGLEERAATLERERAHLTQIAVAQERASIAREMHDVVAHSLAVIIVQADGGRYAMATDPEKGRAVLETVAATGREALDEMRRLIELLRGGGVDDRPGDDDLGRTVVGLDQLSLLATRARSAGLSVDLDCAGIGPTATTTVDLAAYRITQEALTNVLRHAGPRAHVDVTLRRAADGLRISIIDDGGEGTPATVPTGRIGHGLVGMRERVAIYDGTFDAGPRAGGGWAVSASIPLAVPCVPHPAEPEVVDALGIVDGVLR